jgi:hypothetical protein
LESVVEDVPTIEITGLWRACLSTEDETTCRELPKTCSQELPENLPACNKMMVARAFVTIACIISGLSALCLFARAMIESASRRIIIMISKVLPIVSFIAGVIGVAFGIAYILSTNGAKILEAAILGITAVAINTIGSILAFARADI